MAEIIADLRARGDGGYTLTFTGSKERLIAAGLATRSMFPDGRTPTGRERNEKRSTRHHWLVSRAEPGADLWDVHYYEIPMLDGDAEFMKELKAAVLRNAWRQIWHDEEEEE